VLKALIERETARPAGASGRQRPRSDGHPSAADETRVILVDASVRIEHLPAPNKILVDLLKGGEVEGGGH
jgi:hypothetical protein